MMNVVSKIAIGVGAAVAAGIILKKMNDHHKFDRIQRKTNVYLARAKRNAKNMIAKSKHEAEYIKQRAEYAVGRS